jgi:hypothetical protein
MMRSSLLSRRLWIMTVLSISLLFLPLKVSTINNDASAQKQCPEGTKDWCYQQNLRELEHYNRCIEHWEDFNRLRTDFGYPPLENPCTVPTTYTFEPSEPSVEPCGSATVTQSDGMTIEKPCAPSEGECPPGHVMDRDGTLCWSGEEPQPTELDEEAAELDEEAAELDEEAEPPTSDQPLDCRQLGTCPSTPTNPSPPSREQCKRVAEGFTALVCGPISVPAPPMGAACAIITWGVGEGCPNLGPSDSSLPPGMRPYWGVR